jgi:outer membrane murein-binding lipoprotein Lpp
MLIRKSSLHLFVIILILAAVALSGCNIVKTDKKTATLLATVNATQAQLTDEVNRFARVESMRAQMDLKFEDNSFAEFGSKEVYRAADGEVVVQRPGRIRLTVKVPVIKSDVAQMTSDGEKFRVAILQDGGSGKYKKFVMGTNNADYSRLQEDLGSQNGDGAIKKNVNAFANLRPQHFTDAMLVRPTDDQHLYTTSTIFQIEEDETADKKSPLRKVNRGYYLLDEFARTADNGLRISRRFWFDRVGTIRLARQQIFDAEGEIESDIVYGAEGNLTDTGDYNRLPLQIVVTRPQEKYAMKLTYQVPSEVKIGRSYPETAFVLENSWGLEEIDLDKKLQEVLARRPVPPGSAVSNQNSAARYQ